MTPRHIHSLSLVTLVSLAACGGSSTAEPPPSSDTGAVVDSADDTTAVDVAVDVAAETREIPCTTISDCTGATPRCDTTRGVCAGCTTDTDCRGGLHCYAATGECRDCVTDGHCAAPAGFCDFAYSRQCTAKCTSDANCAGLGPSHCDTTAGVCVDCLRGSHCGGGFCELVTHSCVGCLKDSDCPASEPICGPSYECTPKCTSDAQCSGGLKCDPAVGLCVECVTNRHCAGGICQVDHTCG